MARSTGVSRSAQKGLQPAQPCLLWVYAHRCPALPDHAFPNATEPGRVVRVDRPLTHNRLERTLVAACDSGATALVIITKADLAEVADDVVG